MAGKDAWKSLFADGSGNIYGGWISLLRAHLQSPGEFRRDMGWACDKYSKTMKEFITNADTPAKMLRRLELGQRVWTLPYEHMFC